MTEYELSEVVIGYSSTVDQGTAVMISVMSAYLVTAYAIGTNLSRFQVMFISICFTVVFLGLLSGQYFYVSQLVHNYAQLEAIAASENQILQATGGTTVAMFFIVRALFLIGSLYFMWNVRHQKTE